MICSKVDTPTGQNEWHVTEEMRRERESAPVDALEDAQGSSLVVRFMPGMMQSAMPDLS